MQRLRVWQCRRSVCLKVGSNRAPQNLVVTCDLSTNTTMSLVTIIIYWLDRVIYLLIIFPVSLAMRNPCDSCGYHERRSRKSLGSEKSLDVHGNRTGLRVHPWKIWVKWGSKSQALKLDITNMNNMYSMFPETLRFDPYPNGIHNHRFSMYIYWAQTSGTIMKNGPTHPIFGFNVDLDS